MWQLTTFVTLLNFLMLGCSQKLPSGSLMVHSANEGHFEIYRIESESPLQFVSEEIGEFNRPIQLPIGSYLILADCSHEMINISSNTTKELVAHSVSFIPPTEASANDKFTIQCDRFTKTKSRQKIINRFQLNLLHGKRDLLVGMVPLQIDFEHGPQNLKSKSVSYELSGIKLNAYPLMKPKTLFFVSPSQNIISVTENQEFGHWLYLLPGKYKIEVNGTQMDIDLKIGENITINPSFLRVSTSKTLNIDLSSNILGTPLYVVLNENHWLDLNETYPILPGQGLLQLNNSLSAKTLTFVEDELIHMKAKSITVESDCSPWDWDCLGQRKVFLYENEQPFAFTEGITDVPILYFEDDVWISIQGSRDIRYRLSEKYRDYKLKIGLVTLKPNPLHSPGQITDLVRIEALNLPAAGHTLDLPLDEKITVPLIEGSYTLGQYVSNYGGEYERRNIRRKITAKAGQQKTLDFRVFVSEKKYRAHQKRQTQQAAQGVRGKQDPHQRKKVAIVPLDFFVD